MVLASSYPFLDVIWTMIIFFIWVMWFTLLFRIIGDIFRRHDLSGFGKVGWLLFVLFLPFIGVFAYIIANNEGMTERTLERADAQADAYMKARGGTGGTAGAAGEIKAAQQLLADGTITQVEFDSIKAQALAY